MDEPENLLNCWTCGEEPGDCPRSRGQTVLVVDDEPLNRDVLKLFLEQDGYRVEEAAHGLEAVRRFEQRAPDIILMDVHMPVMDGYTAAARIRRMALEAGVFCPILFLSGGCDEPSLLRCIECGGDDFLVKPYNQNILRAKMQSLGRMGAIYGVMQRQRDELSMHHERLRREHEIAERTLSRIMESGCLETDSIRHRVAPVGISSGDMILSAVRPDGTRQVLLGDFTGHGLSAAIGAIPVSDTFLSMTRKGFGVGAIAGEINRKLKSKLPTELFLAACLLEVDSRRDELRCWNGGIPDVLVFRPGVGIVARAASRHLPLGITDDGFDAGAQWVPLAPGDCIVVHSDGVTEAVNADGEMFGDRRLHALIREHRESDQLFEHIWRAVDSFRQGCGQRDDISLLEIRNDYAACGEPTGPEDAGDGGDRSRQCATFDFDADVLRNLDTQQLIADLLRCMRPLRAHRTPIYTLIAELFTNALDHGVLQLESGLKRNDAGFGDYYRERARRLAALEQGWIRLEFEATGSEAEGELRIRISDSGSGFDYRNAGEGAGSFARRGLSLAAALCKRLEFQGAGNSVEAVFAWDEAHQRPSTAAGV